MDVGVGGGEGRRTVTKVMFTKQVGCVIGSEPDTRPAEVERGSWMVLLCFGRFAKIRVVKTRKFNLRKASHKATSCQSRGSSSGLQCPGGRVMIRCAWGSYAFYVSPALVKAGVLGLTQLAVSLT